MLTAPTLHAARRYPDRPAVGDLSYAQLEARVVAAAAQLELAPGDVVALYGPASVDWIVTFHAATRLGAAVLPLSTRWTAPELEDVYARSGARLLLHDPSLEPPIPTACQPFPKGSGTREVPDGHPADRLLLLVPTSGTTGRPKLVRLPWGAAHASAHAVNQVLQLGPQDAWWCALPLFHVGGLGIVMRTALAGAQLVLASKFDPAELQGITVASFVPTMLAATLDWLGDRPWPRELRVAMLGGAAIPPALVARCPVALPSYGLTEACSTLTLAPPGASTQVRETAGPPLPGVEIRILDPGPDGVGRIQVRGPMLMTGYLGHPDREDWLETGDFGQVDANGCLVVAARREDLIISGGENVYPAEVEAALMANPDVAYAAVVGQPDPKWGQTPHAFVVLRDGPPPDLPAWLKPRLARYKHPGAYTVLPALPLLPNGKVDRRALRVEGRDG
jgi:O-succinylbenzoic acid--CoA ligase